MRRAFTYNHLKIGRQLDLWTSRKAFYVSGMGLTTNADYYQEPISLRCWLGDSICVDRATKYVDQRLSPLSWLDMRLVPNAVVAGLRVIRASFFRARAKRRRAISACRISRWRSSSKRHSSATNRWYAIRSNCYPYLDQTKVITACRQHGMAVVAYSPIARGNTRNDGVLVRIGKKQSFHAPARSSGRRRMPPSSISICARRKWLRSPRWRIATAESSIGPIPGERNGTDKLDQEDFRLGD
jgi:hypothetical protein